MSTHRKVGFICASLIALLLWSMIVFPSCNSAAASPIVLYDTAKPQIKVTPRITNRYVLSGNDTMFNLLWGQLNSPIDITPRQLNTLKDWVQKNLKQDTVTNK